MVKSGEIPNFDVPVEILDATPEDVLSISRIAISEGRRVTDIQTTPIGAGFTQTTVSTEPRTAPYPEGNVPGKDRPYRIYESLTPEDRERLIEQ